MNYAWEILDIFAKDSIITGAKYAVTATDGSYSVSTEGNWNFNNPLTKPFEEVVEKDLIDLIDQEAMKDGSSVIKSRLDEQIDYLKNNKSVVAPWLPQVFTPNVG
jgi:hypothetical protein